MAGGSNRTRRLRRLPDAAGNAAVHVDLVTGQQQSAGEAPALLAGVPFRALVESVFEGLAVVGLDGTLLYVNPELAQMFGCRVDDLTGQSLLTMLEPPWRQVASDALSRRRRGVADGYDLDVRLADGHLRHLNVRGAPVRDADGKVTASVAVVRDDTERRDAENELVRMALFDPLTGLPNRATLRDRLAHALARGQRRSGTVALLFCDLDEFKQVNDSLGHPAGDEVLRIVAGRLARAVRPADTIGRFGGDEFLVLCEDLPQPEEAVRIAERLQAALRPRLTVAGTDVTVTASIGIAFASHDQVEPDQLVRNADLAMYRAKALGRARYDVYGAKQVDGTAE
jgi:diguanylate cyclase (GGDEF)-like protein/PAS domain S-box-containing protein